MSYDVLRFPGGGFDPGLERRTFVGFATLRVSFSDTSVVRKTSSCGLKQGYVWRT